jgi:hypothetical protein
MSLGLESFHDLKIPEQALSQPPRQPSLAELNAMNENASASCAPGLERIRDEVKIEKWLEGSTVRLSAPRSIFDVGVVTGDGKDEGSVRLSPIRAMKPSRGRRRVRDVER